MARYKKRADGRYARQVTIGVKDGKPIKKTVYGKTEKELDKNYRDLMFLIDRNIVLDTQSFTLGQLKDEWYRIKKEGKIRRNTELSYKTFLKRMDSLKEMKIKDIKRYHIEKLVSEIQKEGHSNTARQVLKMLSNIFDYAIENDIIYKNPCFGLSVKHKKKTKRPLTENEKNIIDNMKATPKEKAFIYLLRYTGIRRGELFALQKGDIDKDKMTIHISKTIVDNNGKPYVQNLPKTEAGDRIIPIFLKLAKPLFDYMDAVDDFLFLNKKGNKMASASMFLMFNNLLKKLGLGEDLTMHCFRHNFVTECYYAGVDVLTTQSWVGHDDIATTLGIYTHLDKEKILDGEKMDEYYGSQKEVKAKLREVKKA